MKKALTFCLAVMLTGCAARVQHVTNIPNDASGKPVATEDQVKNWDIAVGNLHKVAASVSTLRKTVIDLNKQGVFPDGTEYVLTLKSIGQIDQIEIASVNYLNAVPKTWSAGTARTIQANAQNIAAQLQIINSEGVTGIKNSDSVRLVNQLVSELVAAAQLIISIGGN